MAFPYLIQKTIIALARAEALRRVATERSRFRQWAGSNPRGDTSTNELIMQLNEADAEAKELLMRIKIIKKPVIGRK